MIVLASSGLNLPPELAAHCQIEVTPHALVVDGVTHDVGEIDSLATVRQWVQTAKTPPYLLGSSAPEYVAIFNALVERTSEVLVVTGTRKFMGTYDAAVAASRFVGRLRKPLEARVLDTGLAELGAGLIAAYCGAAARAGQRSAALLDAGQLLADASLMLCAPGSPEFFTKSGASLGFGLVPRDPSELPIIGMKNGEFRPFAQRPSKTNAVAGLMALLQQRYQARSALWVAITYSEDPDPARELLAVVRRYFDVSYALVRPIGPAGYIFLGASSLCICVYPVAAMKLMVKLPEIR